MALTRLLFVLVGAALSLTFFHSEGGEVGVCYGMMGKDLIIPRDVVQLLKKNGITMVRLYDANASVLTALANTGIKVGVSLPNQNVNDAATSMAYATQWVAQNVKAYPKTLIDSVAVGNEVFRQRNAREQLTPQLLPAMKNIRTALDNARLANTVKVSTPIAFDALKTSFPPSAGEFKSEIAQSVMRPMVDFLKQTDSYLMLNFYPYLAYVAENHISLDYLLFRPNDGVLDEGTGLKYLNLYDAMLDAVYYAVEKLGNSREHTGETMLRGATQGQPMLKVRNTETGLPSTGGIGRALKDDDSGRCFSRQDRVNAATKENAQAYNSNLISKVLSGKGTPHYPNADMSVYIFSLFNENLKPGNDDERNFGLFYPDGTPVYKVDFVHPHPDGSVVHQRPKFGNCVLPPRT